MIAWVESLSVESSLCYECQMMHNFLETKTKILERLQVREMNYKMK